MTVPPRYRLSDAEKDALLLEQAALIERLAARVAELEALLGKPKKTSANSHIPPSQDGPGREARKAKRRRKSRPSRPGVARPLAPDPDRTERRLAESCPHCQVALSSAAQRCRHRYDHIDLPEVRPVVTRIELFGGCCGQCGRRYRAEPPAARPPGTPFGPGIRSLLAYLHHSHHVSFERLARMLKELFGLTISEGAIANAFRRMGAAFDTACAAIKAKLLEASIVASDETTTRVNGVTHWQWVFHSDAAVLHTIAPSRGRAVAAEVLGAHQPAVWISDRYAGQQELGRIHQVCLVHTIRTQSTIWIERAIVPGRWVPQRNDMMDLQSVVLHDDALDEELRNGLLVRKRGALKSVAHALTKGREITQHLLSFNTVLTEIALLIELTV